MYAKTRRWPTSRLVPLRRRPRAREILIAEDVPNIHYYRKLRVRASRFRVDLPRKQWCDLWHTHFDWDGFGNLGHVHRRKHINALLTALRRARVELGSQNKPYQLFAAIYLKSSADDALYVHTENPNNTPFPQDFEGAFPVQSLPPLLSSAIDPRHYKILKSHSDDRLCFILLADQFRSSIS